LDADGSDLEDIVSVDNKVGSDEENEKNELLFKVLSLVPSDEENDNGENESIAEIDDDDCDDKTDAQNQLYVLEMILDFHAWYKCGSPYLLGTEEGN